MSGKNRITCPLCNGFGSLQQTGGFYKEGERPEMVENCPECHGEGYIDMRFFIDFVFDDELGGKTYWLPVFVNADDYQNARKIGLALRKGLEKNFKNVNSSNPLPDIEMGKQIIQTKFHIHRCQKLKKINVRVWEFQDIVTPDWNFDEHLTFISNNLPMDNMSVAKCREQHYFPVRVVRDTKHFPDDFNEYLVADVVKVKGNKD